MNRTETSEITGMSPERDKTIRLFTYLKDLCALRTTQVRNVATYDQVFWLTDLPHHRLCRSSIWHLTDPASPTSGQHVDTWIEIRKPALESPPELPDEVEPWIKDEELTDSSLSEPGFFEQIPLSALHGNSDDTDPNALALINDYPHVFDKFVDYIEAKWKPWANEDRELQKVQKAYNQLFNIYQRQDKLGEQYEVIFGAGLLLWKSPNSGEINRHILAIQARIGRDRVSGTISAGSALDGPQPSLECSMLETTDRPNPTELRDIENDAISLDGDPWATEGLERVLKGFVNSLPVVGDYAPSFEHAGATYEKPRLKLAPALILRKRTRRTFEDFYQKIIDQVKEREEIPENIRRIIEIVEDSHREENYGGQVEAGIAKSTPSDNELYFPLPANDKQRRIVQKIEQRRGVLVQGPPGTGKSHTICNLIAHFLAKGKRVLVTSETPRALEVLRRKLHEEMHEIEKLCVVWLGSDPVSQEALKKSVDGITQRKENWNASEELNLSDHFACRLDAERKEQAQLHHDLRECRESDIYQHSSVFGRYSGTLQQIAVQINQERDRFGWFTDRPGAATDPSVTADELLKMAKIHRKLTPENVELRKYRLSPLGQLIHPNEFCRLVDAEQKADRAHKEAQDKRSYPGYVQLSALAREKRNAVKAIIESILATQDALSKHFHSWAERVSREISGGQDRVWRQILSSTVGHIGHIERLLNEHGNLDVTGLDDKDLRPVEEHATALKKHFEMGKGLGFWFVRARVVKDGLYLVESVTVNGKPCKNLQTLNQLTAWIETSTRIKNLLDLWKGITTPPSGSALIQCSAYRDICNPIEDALTLHDCIEEIRQICCDCPGIRFPAWHSQEEVGAFNRALDALNLEEDFATAQRVFKPLVDSLTDFINAGDSHISTQQLRQAVNGKDSGLYRDTYEALSSLHAWGNDDKFLCDVFGRFNSCAPQTCNTYNKSFSTTAWGGHFGEFEAAWAWAKTDRWLDEVSDKERPKRIQQEIENSASRERDALKNLAASKAWQHCMVNLGEKERMALIAWKAAVDHIRGGHGRDVEYWREIARQRMDECRRSVPAWVMPLYQVVQTVRVKKNAFDVVIIDEASQSGPEALLLNYISDKIIVVGDEKQITPVYIGIELQQAHFLRRKYLYDIPYAETLLPARENSLFSQAKLRFGDPIQLREHFRCMPEIIQFCNNLSYTTEPLIPLRQYGADRLEPVRTVFVKDGYRKGSSDDIENPPEAKAIAAQIAECCEDPAYTGKTFGVISLMGSRQAALINGLLLGQDGIGAEEMEKRRLVCGRPYDFQGDERDVIFLSMVAAPQDGQPCRMMRDPDTQRRFNVSVSRARDQLWLFHSATLNDLRPDCLRYKLLEYCLNPAVHQPDEIGETTLVELRRMACDSSIRQSRKKGEKVPGTPFDSWFEVDVFFKIIDRGYRVLPQYPVNTRHIDLVVEGMRGRLAVECDGDENHGMEQWEADQIRQRELGRVGWVFWRVRGCDFYRDPDTALIELWENLDRLKITPRHVWESERKRSETESTPEDRIPVSGTAEVCYENIEDDEEIEEKPPSIEDAEGRLDRALEYARSLKRRSAEMPPLDIQNAILHSLQKCPNYSCTLKSLTSRVLKELGVLTRGNPRLEFEKRVMRNLGALERKGLVSEYKAKNKRIRLLDAEIKQEPLFS
ncbi:AAA family ATPase [Patescibacteria group bacterium]|nr:AAA family ATPase [Patescibacteria group bacterium]